MILNELKKADILAKPVQLTIDGNGSYKTVQGAVLSITFILITFFCSLQILEGLLNPSAKPIISDLLEEEVANYSSVDLRRHRYFTAFLLRSVDTEAPLADPQNYFHFRVARVLVDSVRGSKKMFEMKVVPCREFTKSDFLEHFRSFESTSESAINQYLNYGYCTDPRVETDLTIHGRQLTDEDYSYLQIDVFPCSSLQTCSSSPADLGLVKLEVSAPSNRIRYGNREQPIVDTVGFLYSGQVSLEHTQHIDFSLMTVELYNYKTHRNYKQLFAEYLHLNREATSVSSRTGQTCKPGELQTTCQPFLQIKLAPAGSRRTTFRKYRGIIDAMAEIGGIKETLFMLASFIYLLHHSKKTKTYLVESIFNTDQINHGFRELVSSRGSSERETVDRNQTEAALQKSATMCYEDCLDVRSFVREMCRVKLLFAMVFAERLDEVEPLLHIVTQNIERSRSEFPDLYRQPDSKFELESLRPKNEFKGRQLLAPDDRRELLKDQQGREGVNRSIDAGDPDRGWPANMSRHVDEFLGQRFILGRKLWVRQLSLLEPEDGTPDKSLMGFKPLEQ